MGASRLAGTAWTMVNGHDIQDRHEVNQERAVCFCGQEQSYSIMVRKHLTLCLPAQFLRPRAVPWSGQK